MRTEREMMNTLLDFAKNDERIRLATLEGSRTNRNIAPDALRDYDISYFVTDMESFKQSDEWLDAFGERIMMQKPEDMELFPPELGNWFSYLILFEDVNKVDLTLIPVGETEQYFRDSDGLAEVLLDKDGLIEDEVIASDRQYWIKKPTARAFDDCCNEFWMVSTYVAKGLARKELLFAIDHLHEVARPNLLRMMAWRIGCEHGFAFSVGKNYKFIDRYLPPEHWEALLSTYTGHDVEAVWRALFECHELFRTYSKAVAGTLGYSYPNYDGVVTAYIGKLREEWG
ncbi:aminoglycoside 6-adenylyltransferase [Paenibacillus arenilitoris]|uniref:Aminoglycoside 6-adenylyltransferase n=1 Tax=Paenibacillus arenilitoris TaxID=2772299 RepID=A0A927CLJ6_9BACL|nr:aminoglycoside 6-adenylyltransferase [Paenibacillus arenilitoris]MBD2869032.1 aminoglycoside 6-adenylyltransferase [Paenibacillus arenilitoris]